MNTSAVASDSLRADIVRIDLPCVQCAYNLKGTSLVGVCPECGTSTQRSLDAFSLKDADPAYIHGLRSASLLVIWSVVAMLVVVAGSAIVGVLLALRGGPGGPPSTVWTTSSISALLTIAIQIVFTMGVWKLTREERPDRPFSKLHTPRLLARGASIVLLVLSGLLVVSSMLFNQGMLNAKQVVSDLKAAGVDPKNLDASSWPTLLKSLPIASLTTMVVSTVVTTVAWLVLAGAILWYCRWLLRRVGQPAALRFMSVLAWATGVLAFLTLCMGFSSVVVQIAVAVGLARFLVAIRPYVALARG